MLHILGPHPLKGQSNKIFDLHFLKIIQIFLHGPLTNVFKYFRFWLRICQVIQIFQSPRGMIPQGVNLPGV